MKTKNVILLGVVGVGAVGAYMFMKNKQKQDAMLNGFMPTTPSTTTGATTSGITTSGTTTSGTTTPPLSTATDGITPSDANLNLANATVLVGERALALQASKKSCLGGSAIPSGGGFGMGGFMSSSSSLASCESGKQLAKKKVVELDAQLAKLGYKVDTTGALVKI